MRNGKMNKEFTTALFHHCEGYIEMRALPGKKRSFAKVDDPTAVAAFCSQHQGQNLFIGVATRDGKGGAKKNIIDIPAVWVDIDFKDTPMDQVGDGLAKVQFAPSITVLSGGGVHFYWLLTEPVGGGSIGVVEDVTRRIAHVMDGDMGAVDAARILRIPGTKNHKYNPPRSVKLHRLENFTYELETFIDALPEAPKHTRTNTNTDYKTIENVEAELSKCEFIKWCADHPSDVPEPLWYALISNLSCARPGGFSLCHKLSKGHQKYTPEETTRKIHHAMDNFGPHKCQYIHNHGFKCARTCNVKAPVGLAVKKRGNPANVRRSKTIQVSYS